jgi:hypothetical protein
MKRGDFVLITYQRQVKRCMVLLASENGRSLMLGFDGALHEGNGGMFIGSMPVLQDDDGTYRDLIGGHQVVIEPAQRDA